MEVVAVHKVVKVTNAYVPPASLTTPAEAWATCNNMTIEIEENEIAICDRNAHDKWWYPKTKSDTQLVNLDEKLLDNEVRVENTGDARGMDPRTGNLTALR